MHLNPRNPLLVRDELGRARISTRDLPTDPHRYGLHYRPRLEGTKELIHCPTGAKQGSLPPLEKGSTKELAMQMKNYSQRADIIELTKNKEVRVKRKVGSSVVDCYLPNENLAYGKPNANTASMKLVMGMLSRKQEWRRRGKTTAEQVLQAHAAKKCSESAQG